MGLGYCSKVVSTVFGVRLSRPSILQAAPKGATRLPAAAMAKKPADMPAEGILNWVPQYKFGGHAHHMVAPYGFVDGTGA